MKREKIGWVILITPGLLFFGYILVSELSQDCHTVSTGQCRLLWFTSVLSVLGGVWLGLWTITRRPKFLYEPKEANVSIWQRAGLRVILSGLLASAPLLVRGSFVIVVGGVFFGVLLVGLFGRLTGRITD